MDTLTVNSGTYSVIRLLGHGKGGYSWLAERDGTEYVIKQIHHEPCSYYTFGNKIEAERNDYQRLLAAGIRIPRMLEIDMERERIVKEFIDGATAAELAQAGKLTEEHIRQVQEMAQLAMAAGLNIDYYPTNFIMQDDLLYYIDYECNPYEEQWSFERWGAKYWSNTAKQNG